jgi:hypothetical protein
VFEHEVPVEQNRLNTRQRRIVVIEVAPARLDDRQFLVDREIRHRAPQEVRGRHEVGIEDGDEFTGGGLESRLERAGFETRPVGAVVVRDVEPAARVALNRQLRDVAGLVGRIVQNLDLQLLARVVDAAHRIDQRSTTYISL